MSENKSNEVESPIEYKLFSDFLESNPPNQITNISNLVASRRSTGTSFIGILSTPDIHLFCENEYCNGERFFRFNSNYKPNISPDEWNFEYIKYLCANCQQNQKTYSLAIYVDSRSEAAGQCYKFGELPPYGPPVSPKLIKLIGPDRDEFLKGRRCENQGLGVGAFTYYRRVVENQKNRILKRIIDVSNKIGAQKEKIEILESALTETQFSKALSMTKDSIPESLLINGHNPILLLHSALSKGVHTLTDEKCLEYAESVRVVLGELSDKLSQALKDEDEIKKALSTLVDARNNL